MILELLAGALVGAGLMLLVSAVSRPVPGIAATLSRLDRTVPQHDRPLTASAAEGVDGRLDRMREGIGTRFAAEIEHRGWTLARTRTDRQARRVLVTVNSAQANTAAGLERIKRQPVPRFYDLFTRGLAWFFALIVCTRMDTGGHNSAVGIVLGILIMALVILAERLGCLLEDPMSDDVFGLPLDRFCGQLSADLLGPAQPRRI